MNEENPPVDPKEVESALRKISKIAEEIEKMEWNYERLVSKREKLLLQAVIAYWKSIALKDDYLYDIRLNYSTYEYDCGMLNENLTRELLNLDGVTSNGNEEIRTKRKEQVKRILQLQDQTTILHKRAATLSLFYRSFVSAPRYQALLAPQEPASPIPTSPVVEEPPDEPINLQKHASLKRKKSVHVIPVLSPQEFEEARRRAEEEKKQMELSTEERKHRKAEKRRAKKQAKKHAEETRRKEEEERMEMMKRKAEEEAKKAEEAKRQEEEEARRKAELQRKVEEEAKRKAEEEAKKKAELQRQAEEMKRQEKARQQAEEEARKRVEEAKRQEEEAKRKAELQRKAEEEAKRQAEEEAERQAALKRQEEEEAKRQAAMKQAEENNHSETKEDSEDSDDMESDSESLNSAEVDSAKPDIEEEDEDLDSIHSDFNPKYQWLRQDNQLHLILMNVDFDQKSLRCITRPAKPTPKVIIQGYRIEKDDRPVGYYGLFYGSRPSYRYIPFTTVLNLPDVPIDLKKAPRATYYDDQNIMQITYSILPEHVAKPEVQKSYKRPSPQPAVEEEEPPRYYVNNPLFPDIAMRDRRPRVFNHDPRYDDYDSDGESGYYNSPYYRNPYNPYRQRRQQRTPSFYPFFGNGFW